MLKSRLKRVTDRLRDGTVLPRTQRRLEQLRSVAQNVSNKDYVALVPLILKIITKLLEFARRPSSELALSEISRLVQEVSRFLRKEEMTAAIQLVSDLLASPEFDGLKTQLIKTYKQIVQLVGMDETSKLAKEVQELLSRVVSVLREDIPDDSNIDSGNGSISKLLSNL
eukprot:GILK01011365.1.p1 GENE.GILK01011365.1~~GILK01011365.1.p1  ORF type:complete len:169 (-),score=29.85 GILK01011365.1:131-637(-)